MKIAYYESKNVTKPGQKFPAKIRQNGPKMAQFLFFLGSFWTSLQIIFVSKFNFSTFTHLILLILIAHNDSRVPTGNFWCYLNFMPKIWLILVQIGPTKWALVIISTLDCQIYLILHFLTAVNDSGL